MMYAGISETEYYGGKTSRDMLATYESYAEAREWADGYNPDYDDSVGCARLSHNQASATCGQVHEITQECGDTNPYDDWDLLPEVVSAALVARGRELVCEYAEQRGEEAPEIESISEQDACEAIIGDSEEMESTIAYCGYWIGELDGNYYVVKTGDVTDAEDEAE